MSRRLWRRDIIGSDNNLYFESLFNIPLVIMENEGEKKKSLQDDKKTKRRKKAPSQLELLESVFAEEMYLSEAFRSDLFAQLGLSERQLQMWSCHGNLKDRKKNKDENSDAATEPRTEKNVAPSQYPASVLASVIMESALMAGNFYANEFGAAVSGYMQEEAVSCRRKPAAKRRPEDAEGPARKIIRRNALEGANPRRAAELRAIASVEAQLGELLREDGPVLGIQFDSLPPGAFTLSAGG